MKKMCDCTCCQRSSTILKIIMRITARKTKHLDRACKDLLLIRSLKYGYLKSITAAKPQTYHLCHPPRLLFITVMLAISHTRFLETDSMKLLQCKYIHINIITEYLLTPRSPFSVSLPLPLFLILPLQQIKPILGLAPATKRSVIV